MFMTLSEICTIEQRISHDGYTPTYGTTASVRCQYHDAKEESSDGKTFIVPAWVMLPTGTAISETSRITLPNGTQPPIKSFKDIRNYRTDKIEGIKVTLGKVGGT
jgi:hypothetical protein